MLTKAAHAKLNKWFALITRLRQLPPSCPSCGDCLHAFAVDVYEMTLVGGGKDHLIMIECDMCGHTRLLRAERMGILPEDLVGENGVQHEPFRAYTDLNQSTVRAIPEEWKSLEEMRDFRPMLEQREKHNAKCPCCSTTFTVKASENEVAQTKRTHRCPECRQVTSETQLLETLARPPERNGVHRNGVAKPNGNGDAMPFDLAMACLAQLPPRQPSLCTKIEINWT